MLAKEVDPPIRPRIERGLLDVSNFDEELTKQTPCDSPPSTRFKLTKSQQMLFENFTYVRVSPFPSDMGVNEMHRAHHLKEKGKKDLESEIR